MDALPIMAGLAQGIDRATQNLFNIAMYKYKLKQENEMFGLDKKIKELQLKKAEFSMEPEQIALETEKFKNEVAAHKAATNLANMQATAIQTKLKEEIKTSRQHAQLLNQYFRDGGDNLPYGTSINVGGVTVRGTTSKPSLWDLQKEARTTVNAMVNNNPLLQVQTFKDPSLLTNLINDEVERLKKKYLGTGGIEETTLDDFLSQF